MASSPWNTKTKLTSAMRRLWRSSPAYREAYEHAKEEFTVLSTYGKAMRRVRFVCASCGHAGAREVMQCDHVRPAVPLGGWEGWDSFVTRLFCPAIDLRILCQTCHDRITAEQRAERVLRRRAAKAKLAAG